MTEFLSNKNPNSENENKPGSNFNILKINNNNTKNIIKGKNKKNKEEKKNTFINTKDKLVIKSKTKAKTKQEKEIHNSTENNFHLKTVKNKNEYKPELNAKNLNDEELNNLVYDLALLIDKRTYFQYYWPLLMKKQLIFFTFLPSNDYNLKSIKILLFYFLFHYILQ